MAGSEGPGRKSFLVGRRGKLQLNALRRTEPTNLEPKMVTHIQLEAFSVNTRTRRKNRGKKKKNKRGAEDRPNPQQGEPSPTPTGGEEVRVLSVKPKSTGVTVLDKATRIPR